MTRRYRKKKGGRKQFLRKMAEEHIETLFTEAQKVASKNITLATQYVRIARKTGMKVRTKLPRKYQRQFCKYCYSYLVPGKNARVRLRGKKKTTIVITCLNCRRITRYPVK
ncbi:MAG: ribonuclease P protein component 4 [Candidatus Hodarchaeota archaeon]